MMYSATRPERPNAASSFVCGKLLRVLMMTLYVAARVLNIVDIGKDRIRTSIFLLKTSDAHQTWNLASCNTDSRACHKTTDCGCWDEFNKPTNAEETYSEDNESADECQNRRDLGARPLCPMSLFHACDDLCHSHRHYRHGTNRDILGGRKKLEERISRQSPLR